MTKRNLFHVDLEAVKAIVTEANSNIANRSRELLLAAERMPTELGTESDIQKATKFARLLKDQVRECRTNRLTDQKSFRDASKIIEGFYADFEKPLKSALSKVSSLIGRSTVADARASSLPVQPVDVVKAESGVTVAQYRTAAERHNTDAGPAIEWMVAKVDRQTVDLEKLRAYFTDATLKQAASRHLVENGPNSLPGVSYAKIAAI